MVRKKEMTEKKKSLLNMCSGLSYQAVLVVVGLVIPRMILIHYGSEINGFLNSITQLFNYVALLEAGVGAVTNQALYGHIVKNDHAGISSCLQAAVHYYHIAGFLYSIAILLFALLYPVVFRVELRASDVFWVIILTGMNGFSNLFIAGKYRILLEADGRKYVLNNISIVISVFANIVKVLLIFSGYTLVVMQLGFSLVNLLQIFVIFYYVKIHYDWLDNKAKPDFNAVSQRYSALVHQISGLIFGSADILLITAFCNLKLVSVYSVYNMVTNMVSNFLSQISGSVMYRMGQIYQSDKERFLVYHHAFEIVNFVLVFTAFSIAYLFMIPFMALYTKGVTDINYLDEKLPLLFVTIQLLSCGRTATCNVVQYAGHFKKTQWRSILESVINLTVSIIGIHYLGMYGALIGTIAALLYRSNDMIFYAAKKLLGISPWYTYRRWLSCGMVFVGIVLIKDWFSLEADNYIILFGKMVCVGVVLLVIYAGTELWLERKFIKKLVYLHFS